MKTIKEPFNYSRSRMGKVKVVNAIASIHQILDEIAPNGSIHCNMTTTESNAVFVFTNRGIRATLQIEKGGEL